MHDFVWLALPTGERGHLTRWTKSAKIAGHGRGFARDRPKGAWLEILTLPLFLFAARMRLAFWVGGKVIRNLSTVVMIFS